MTIVDRSVVCGGVDTHLDNHVAAALNGIGGVVGIETFETTEAGYRKLVEWLEGFGPVLRVGVEGTGSYGTGLTRFLHDRSSALDSDLIVRTPCRGIKLPPKSQIEMRFLTADEVAEVAHAIDEPYRALVLTAAYTGCRFGELAGLRVRRLDLLRRSLTVTETLSDVRGQVRLAPPKTTAARRQVALPKFLSEELARHLSQWPPGSDGFVFASPEGGPMRRTNFRRRTWLPAVRASVGEPLRFHDLRHSHAAMLIAQGEHPKVIQIRLGHSSIQVTLDNYGHLFEGLDEAAADRLNATFQTAYESPSRGDTEVGVLELSH